MIFESLNESAERGELWLRDGAFCHWHLRRDGQLTIREILVLPDRRGQGLGKKIIEDLTRVKGAQCLVALCPEDLPSNGFYEAMGFVHCGTKTTRTGRVVNIWAKAVMRRG